MKSSLTAVIQAGGRSSRMGRDKALVPLGGNPMVTHVIEAVRPLSDALLLVTNNQSALARFNVPMVSDAEPGAGALHGLQTALAAASSKWVLLVACDMPFVSTPLLQFMLAVTDDVDVVVPHWQDRLQPTCAVYRRTRCLMAVKHALANGKRRMIGWFEDVRVREVNSAEIRRFDPNGRTFFNVNTPDDLAQAEQLLEAI